MTSTPTAPAPLVGAELLAKCKELGNIPKNELALACGYTKKDGKPMFVAFYEALLAARGQTLQPAVKTATKPKAGKPLSYSAKLTKIGSVPIGAAYTAMIGAGPGDSLTIEIIDGHEIKLTKQLSAPAACPAPVAAAPASVDPGEEEEADDDDDDDSEDDGVEIIPPAAPQPVAMTPF